MDFQSIKSNVDIVDVVGNYVALKKKGGEYVGICPFHDDHDASLQVNDRKQIFKCFACGEGGDSIDFLVAMGKTHKEAVEELTGGAGTDAKRNRAQAHQAKAPKWVQVSPAHFPCPAEIMQEKHKEIDGQWVRLKYIAHWEYKDKNGALIGYAVRFQDPQGEKDVYPLTFRTDGNRHAWRWQGFDAPRPLYNLHLIEANPKATILLVEGEKTADAAQAQFAPDKVVCATWIGGANGVAKADFSPLQGRRVILFPDNDAVGISAMLHIRHITPLEASKIIPLDATLPKGWDCADKAWAEGELREFVLSRMVADIPANAGESLWSFKEIGRESIYEFGLKNAAWTFKDVTPDVEDTPTVDNTTADSDTAAVGTDTATVAMPAVAGSMPADEHYEAGLPPDEPTAHYYDNYISRTMFRMLGFDKSEGGTQKFHFFVFASSQVVSLSPSSMTKSNLLLLAPLDWWEMNFPGQKMRFDVDAASNFLINASIKIGIFNPDNVRGRGAWMDGKDTVIHCGGYLLVNGQPFAFNEYRSKFIYERAFDLGFELSEPASNIEGKALLDMCAMINWERPISAYFLAGWCVVAPVCGALKWRPHLWITGPAGTGKSWIFEKVMRRLLSGTALAVQSETTEAGIRQYLGQDALPVMFDEAEGEDRKAHERIQGVLTLMRGASTSDGGMIIKGSAGGSAMRYSIRSCFAYASIGVSLSQQSDRSRVTVLSVSKAEGKEGQERWKALQKAYIELIGDDFVKRLQSRTVALLPVILKNAETFSAAAAAVLGDQRAGDQIGAILAGAYSLVSNKAITFDEATKWIEARDWSEERALEGTKDEVRLITHLMERIARVEVDGKYLERTVGELVTIATAPAFYDDSINAESARKRLLTMGFRVDQEAGALLVSNTAEFVKQSLRDTPWANNHLTILKRLKGAKAKDQTTFGSHIKSRAIEIPLQTIFGEDA